MRDRQLVSVLTDAQPPRLEDIEKLPIATAPDGVAITLGSIAEVHDGYVDRREWLAASPALAVRGPERKPKTRGG